MIGRLFRMLVIVAACFCVGTVVSTVAIAVSLSVRWQLNRGKLVQMLAIAQGIDLFALHQAQPPPAEATETQQPSLEEVIEARAIKSRDLELREQALRNSLEQARFEQAKLERQRKDYQQARDAFQNSLATIQKQATDSGWEEVRQTLLTIKPKQAKELLWQMLERNELQDVATLLGPMPDNKRAKILGEFKTEKPEEIKKIDELLQIIRRGDPTATVASGTQRQVGSGNNQEGTPR